MGCKTPTKLALVASAFSLLDGYCTSGALGNLPLTGTLASIREVALYTGRSLGLWSQKIEIQCHPRAPNSWSYHVTFINKGLSLFVYKMG